MTKYIAADWPAPKNIQAFYTTRKEGVSKENFASFNLALHVNDQAEHVAKNRAALRLDLALSAEPLWLKQVHSTHVIEHQNQSNPEADAAFTRKARQACVVMSGDCLPLLVCNKQGDEVAAIHAGWRGLLNGVIDATIDAMQSDPDDLLVWLGPAISQKNYEVNDQITQQFIARDSNNTNAFIFDKEQHPFADLYQLARNNLNRLGVNNIYGGDRCTYDESEYFYSHRRDGGITGRMASLIWIL